MKLFASTNFTVILRSNIVVFCISNIYSFGTIRPMIQCPDFKCSPVFIDKRMTFVWVFNLLKYESFLNECPVHWEHEPEKLSLCGGTLLNNFCGKTFKTILFLLKGAREI